MRSVKAKVGLACDRQHVYVAPLDRVSAGEAVAARLPEFDRGPQLMTRTLDHLLDRNVLWATEKRRDDPSFFQRMAEQQAPNLLWIGCSDSRITANDVLRLDPGEVFVHRNIANVVHTSDLNILSVLEFAIDHLKVEHVIVCGHYGCSGIRRALADERSAMLDHWLQPITMLYRKHKDLFARIVSDEARIDRMCEVNVEMQVRRIAATPIVEKAWSRGQSLNVHGWIYAIADGLLRDLGPHLSSVEERDALLSIDDRVRNPSEAVSAMRRQAIDAFAQMDVLDALAAAGADDGGCCPGH